MRVLGGLVVAALATGVLVGQAKAADQAKPAAGSKAAAAQTVVTGQNRGYTNDKLYLRLDDDKEITLIVDIPGDKDRKWQNEYKMNSRITVTYHPGPDGRLIATAIKQADAPGK